MKDATSLNKLWSKPSECIPTTCYHGLLILTSKLSNWLEIQELFWIVNSSSLSTRVYYISRKLDLTNSLVSSKVKGVRSITFSYPFLQKTLPQNWLPSMILIIIICNVPLKLKLQVFTNKILKMAHGYPLSNCLHSAKTVQPNWYFGFLVVRLLK